MKFFIFFALLTTGVMSHSGYSGASLKHDLLRAPKQSEIDAAHSRFSQGTDLERLIQDAKRLDVPKKIEPRPQSDSPSDADDAASQRAKENALEGLEKKLDRDAIRDLRER